MESYQGDMAPMAGCTYEGILSHFNNSQMPGESRAAAVVIHCKTGDFE